MNKDKLEMAKILYDHILDCKESIEFLDNGNISHAFRVLLSETPLENNYQAKEIINVIKLIMEENLRLSEETFSRL